MSKPVLKTKMTVVQNNMKKKLTPQITQKYKSIQQMDLKLNKLKSNENEEQISPKSLKFFRELVNTQKLQARTNLLHSFSIVGVDKDWFLENDPTSEPEEAPPSILHYYPESIYKNKQVTEDYLYL